MFFFNAGAILANMLGYALGLGVSFVLNQAWTFNSSQRLTQVLPRYILTAGGCYLLNLGVVGVSALYFSANPYLAQIFGVGVYTVCMFFGCRWFVFGSPRVVVHPWLRVFQIRSAR